MSNYLLENLDNYKKTIDNNINDIYLKYTEQICDFIENVLYLKIENNSYILKKGFEILTHVFKYIYLYTFNLELSLYHMKKSQIYYIEFVTQINNDNNIFLKLTLKDSALFVYKKSIFDISTEYKNNFNISNYNSYKIDLINKCIDIYILNLSSLLDNIKNNNNIINVNNSKNINLFNNKINNTEILNINVCNKEFINIKNLLNKHTNNQLIILLSNISKNISKNINTSNNNIDNYDILDTIYSYSNYIINDLFKNINEDLFDKNIFLINSTELLIKIIIKNYMNNLFIKKEKIENKLMTLTIDNEQIKNYLLNNHIKFVNSLFI
jgi:hypothetical protein